MFSCHRWSTGGILVVLSALLLATPAPAAIIHVDDNAPNDPGPGDPLVSDPAEDGSPAHPFDAIQEGIDAASSGDEVVIADGTYTGDGNRDLDFLGKAITVRSASGDPTTCVIDCGGTAADPHRGFYFHSGEGPDSVIEGVTVTGGVARGIYGGGGGIYCDGSSPTINGCLIKLNFANLAPGGGLCCRDGANPTLVQCTLSDNVSTGYGGGVYCDASDPTLTDCTVSGNTAWDGGGLYCEHTCAQLLACRISGNTAEEGGGVWSGYSSALSFIDCDIDSNVALDVGGGFASCTRGTSTLSRCRIIGNSAAFGAGGLYCELSEPVLDGCDIRSNTVSGHLGRGGGVWCGHLGLPSLFNCTISGNTAYSGGGLHSGEQSEPVLINCTIAANSAVVGPALACDPDNDSAPNTVTLANCVLWNGTAQVWYNDASVLDVTYCDVEGGWPGEGNVDLDPQFAFDADHRLTSGSPCIDAGTNTPPVGLPANDLDGTGRPLDGDGNGSATADMGAFEFDPDAPAIALSADHVVFSFATGEGTPLDQTLSVRNCGGGMLNWSISGQPTWLIVTPVSGTSSDEVDDVMLSVDAAGLPAGTHTGSLVVADPLAGNGPRTVAVTLHVTRTLEVPAQYTTIQAAIDAAVADGDVVEVADGTYTGTGNKDLDFHGKAITVRSASGDPNLCVIDCEGDGRGFHFHSGEGSDSVVEGLTITNGSADSGGGVYCVSSSPMLANCTLSGNCASQSGGGVSCGEGSHPLLVGCRLEGNATGDYTGGYGGGLSCGGQSCPTLIGCEITGNEAFHNGGGIYCTGSCAPALTDCVIASNFARSQGGGLGSVSSSPIVTGCQFNANRTNGRGGGVYCGDFGEPVLDECVISHNTAMDDGGGIWVSECLPTLTNCLITGNRTFYWGGGVRCGDDAQLSLVNCAITRNCADLGGGVYCTGASAALTNCTVAANIAGDGSALACDSYMQDDPSSVTVSNSILWSSAPPIWNNDDSTLMVIYCNIASGWEGEGNIDVDPRFAFANDFHLLPDSPCIDTGGSEPPGSLPSHDLDGNPRLLDGNGDASPTVDMGAYEFNPATPSLACSQRELRFFGMEDGDNPTDQILSLRNSSGGSMDWNITGLPAWLSVTPASGDSSGEVDTTTLSVDNSGLTHGVYTACLEVSAPAAINTPREVQVTLHVNRTFHVPGAYPTIQTAIDAAIVAGDVVELADGTYTGPGNRDLDFGGKEITLRGASGDPNLCVIDCEGDARGFEFHSGEGSSAVVRDVTIAHSWRAIDFWNSDPTLVNCVLRDGGSGAYCVSCSPTFTACTIRDNSSSGVYCDYYSHPVFTNCNITGNRARDGGGVLSEYFSDPTFVSCTISGNSARYGGGLKCTNSAAWLVNCDISDNSADEYGGGLISWHDAGGMLIVNCTIARNCAGSTGGGVSLLHAGPQFNQCNISGNTASHGGALFAKRGSNPTLRSCTFATNVAEFGSLLACDSYEQLSPSHLALTNCILWSSGGAIWNHDGSIIDVAYSNIAGGWPGEGNIDADPLFVRPPDDGGDGWGDDAETPDVDEGANDDFGDLRLSSLSPCIDAGDNAAVPADVLDLDGDGDLAEPLPFDLAGVPRFTDDPDSDDSGLPHPDYPDLPMVDMGAYEFAPPAPCKGDSNCSGYVDWRDIDFFVAAQYDNVSAWYALHMSVYGTPPTCPFENNDIGGPTAIDVPDGHVDWRDIDGFVAQQNMTCP